MAIRQFCLHCLRASVSILAKAMALYGVQREAIAVDLHQIAPAVEDAMRARKSFARGPVQA